MVQLNHGTSNHGRCELNGQPETTPTSSQSDSDFDIAEISFDELEAIENQSVDACLVATTGCVKNTAEKIA
jgi:hypothetical protein